MNSETTDPTPEIDALPQFIAYPEPGPQWDVIPLGVDRGGSQVAWDVTAHTHALVAGPPGGGKSVAQRVVAAHAVAHPTHWHVVGIDPTFIEMGWLAQHAFAAVHTQSAAQAIHDLRAELDRRLVRARDRDVADTAILVLVDAADALVRDEDVAADLTDLARFGRAAGIHLHVSTHDPLRLPRPLLENLLVRVAHKAITETESMVLFGTRDAADLPRVHGRSYGGTPEGAGAEFQAFYLAAD